MIIQRAMLVSLCLLAAGTTPAYAYLDPGTGSIIIQAVVGSIAAGAAVVGVYWNSVRTYFSRRLGKKPPSGSHAQKKTR